MAVIFDIQRGSMHDGPGIRTTVFFKGCPLDCKWCHNPESKSPRAQLAFFAEKCVSCGECAAVCGSAAHLFSQEGHAVDFQKCVRCGKCVAVCGSSALRIYGGEVSAEEIMATVLKDKAYYQATGGGLTVSGGEPFMQYSELIALLKAAKAEGIHTCVETCGFAPTEHILAAAEYTDLFLFDCKESDPARHKAFTGADNSLIAENFDRLYQAGANILLRCPVIPGYNDNDAHIEFLASVKGKYPRLVGQELLFYHELGKGKAEAIGEEYSVNGFAPSEEEKLNVRRRLISLGADEAFLI